MSPLFVPGPVAAGGPVTRLVVATRNPGKLAEIRALLGDLGHPLELLSLDDFAGAPEVEETGETYRDNARLKALSALAHTGLPSLADDTGLEVDALGGEPGVHSARFAGPAADPAANRARLLGALAGVPDGRRTARFRCVLALARPGVAPGLAELEFVEGVVEGSITFEARGGNGFGYDPIFEVAGTRRTMAELSDTDKNAISHRGRALRELRRYLVG